MIEEEKTKIVNLINGLISYIDAYSRKVIAWDLCTNQKTEVILRVLKKAISARHPSSCLIVHSDKESQMRSKAYRGFCINNNIALSYTSIDHSCDENAMQESFRATIKKRINLSNQIRKQRGSL